MSTAKLNGKPCARVTLVIPPWGIPHAEAHVNDETELAGAVTLELADLTMKAFVVPHRSGAYRGRTHYRLVCGAGGWQKTIRAQEYRNDAGVKAAKVIQDAALLAGEKLADIVAPYDKLSLGVAWVRPAQPAAATLQAIAERNWYVELDGITHLGARAPSAPTVEHVIEDVESENARITIAAEKIAQLLPGITFEGGLVGTVVHEVTEEKLRTHLSGAV